MNDASILMYTSNRMVDKNVKFISKDKIIQTIESHFDTTIEDMASHSRKRTVAYPRQMAMYFLVKYTQLSLEAIGDIFGGLDHTTVIHASRGIRDWMDVYENVAVEVKELTQKIYA
jgi:chromosomal replication initiator protein